MAPAGGLVIERQALDGLAALLLERVGLKITPDGYYGLRLALSARMPALGLSDAAEYVRRLKGLAGEHELRSLLPLVTVGKTEFFRDLRQFQAIERVLLPRMLSHARHEIRRVSIWSAGCATGEEPYSLAMSAADLGARPSEVDIWATDLNPVAVEFAKAGRYPNRRIGGISEARLKRYFQPTGEGWEAAESVRAFIRFEGLNLAAPVFPKVEPRSLDLILCRNVIIYFDVPTIRGLMERFLTALRPGGVLLLGYSESLFKVYDRFEMFEVEGAFAYRRPEEEGVVPAPASSPGAATRPGAPPRAPARPPVATRPAAPGVSPSAPPRAPRPTSPPSDPPTVPAAMPRTPLPAGRSPADRLDAAVRRMDAGDFEGAREAVSALCTEFPDDLAALLTWGNIHSLMGENSLARQLFDRVLAQEPLCVEARVFAGIAALQSGKLQDARAELTKALFLEPTLALGHYLLAEVQEKLKDRDGARRSYRNALAQLRHPQRPLAGHYPDLPDSNDATARAARYALAALEESV